MAIPHSFAALCSHALLSSFVEVLSILSLYTWTHTKEAQHNIPVAQEGSVALRFVLTAFCHALRVLDYLESRAVWILWQVWIVCKCSSREKHKVSVKSLTYTLQPTIIFKNYPWSLTSIYWWLLWHLHCFLLNKAHHYECLLSAFIFCIKNEVIFGLHLTFVMLALFRYSSDVSLVHTLNTWNFWCPC